jgi:hypothetical protein
MTTCPSPGEMVDDAINRLATQYRESEKLKHLIRTYVAQVEEAAILACALPSFFDIETAVGDQLTIIGKRMGWPRCHCVCDTQPVFGFECAGVVSEVPLAGFCDDNVTWADCGIGGFAEICIVDDAMYRATLLARRYQMQALYDLASLTAAVRHLYGPQALILDAGVGRVVIAPGRPLTNGRNCRAAGRAPRAPDRARHPRALPLRRGRGLRFRRRLGRLLRALRARWPRARDRDRRGAGHGRRNTHHHRPPDAGRSVDVRTQPPPLRLLRGIIK